MMLKLEGGQHLSSDSYGFLDKTVIPHPKLLSFFCRRFTIYIGHIFFAHSEGPAAFVVPVVRSESFWVERGVFIVFGC
jgi:hypothetical protein